MKVELLETELIGKDILKSIIYFEQIESTNDYAKKNLVSSDTLIITNHQINGKGRFNRDWISSPGVDATFTFVKQIPLRLDEIHLVNFYVSMMIYKTLVELNPEIKNSISLKWPNDVLLNSKKISGILTEVKDLKSKVKTFNIGVGVNLNGNDVDSDISHKATTLLKETGKLTDREKFIVGFVKNFYGNIEKFKSPVTLISEWKSCSKMIGAKVKFRVHEDSVELEGLVKNVEDDGALVMEFNENSTKKFYSGEISIDYNFS